MIEKLKKYLTERLKVKGLGDDIIHAMHSGCEREVELRVSDLSKIILQLEQAEKMREENKTLRRWSFNHIDALLLYVSYPEDSHVKEAVEFANIIADGRKLRMAHLQGSGWHPARATLSQVNGEEQ